MSKRTLFTTLHNDYTEWLQRTGYAKSTIKGKTMRLKLFLDYITGKGITKLEDITPQIINHYQEHTEKQPISSKTIGQRIGELRSFDHYLENYGHAPIVTTKLRITPGISTPQTLLTQAEIKALYQATDQSALGFRDRAMLAVYYGCGLRAMEGVNLQMKEVDFKTGLLQVAKTKTYSPRYVPMSEHVQHDLQDWLDYGRKLILKTKSNTVLVHGKGQYKDAKIFNDRLKNLLVHASIDKKITLHGLRHSIATHLLENGMELEQIRQFLGHHSLEVTQRYTHILYANT